MTKPKSCQAHQTPQPEKPAASPSTPIASQAPRKPQVHARSKPPNPILAARSRHQLHPSEPKKSAIICPNPRRAVIPLHRASPIPSCVACTDPALYARGRKDATRRGSAVFWRALLRGKGWWGVIVKRRRRLCVGDGYGLLRCVCRDRLKEETRAGGRRE